MFLYTTRRFYTRAAELFLHGWIPCTIPWWHQVASGQYYRHKITRRGLITTLLVFISIKVKKKLKLQGYQVGFYVHQNKAHQACPVYKNWQVPALWVSAGREPVSWSISDKQIKPTAHFLNSATLFSFLSQYVKPQSLPMTLLHQVLYKPEKSRPNLHELTMYMNVQTI